jgi:hypothetical protein
MEEMYFNDQWMELEPLHTHALNAAAEIAADHCGGDPSHVSFTGDFLFHFMSCWYQAILDGKGALVGPAVKSTSWFVQHMIEEHDMPHIASVPCAALLVRFTALVITKSGGKLI